MKPLKTIALTDLVDSANHFFLHSHDNMRAERRGLHTFVSGILHDRHAYGGFRYLTEADMAHSHGGDSVGIVFRFDDAAGHLYPDDSRIQFSLKG